MNDHSTPRPSVGTTDPHGPRPRSWALIIVVIMLAAAAAAAAWGISSRARTLATLSRETRDLSVPTVAVTRPEKSAAQEDLSLPGNIQPYTDAAIFARTTGYLKQRYADIGSRVKAGQLLAEIDTPEIDQQLLQARADLATAEANARLAQTTAERYRDLIKSDSVAQQDVDNANGNYDAKRAEVQSAVANVRRLEQLQAFKKIYAPFDGVITARNTDIGALIGSNTNAKELFHIASTHKLRVYVNVPQTYSRDAASGLGAEIELHELPGRRFKGTLVRTSEAIDPTSRTLLAEIDLDNPAGELLPGSYAEVHLKLPARGSTFRLPVNTLIFRAEGVRVALVNDRRITLAPVTLGRDFGSNVEIVSGLKGDESIVVNPPDSLTSGQIVRVAAEAGSRGTAP
jgi:RND family efflux transporter MFP subunit